MGLTSTRDKRDRLRLFFAQARQGSNLQDVLMGALQACDDVAPNGTWLSSGSEAGGNASQSILLTMDPVIARRLVGELLDLYDKVSAYLVDAGTASPTDAQIYNQMMGVNGTAGPQLVRVGNYANDYSGMIHGL